MILQIGTNFPKDPNILAVQTWRPASDRQAEGRIWRIHRKIHKKRRNQSEAYHNRIQKKWDKRWKQQMKSRVPTVHILYPHQQAVVELLERKKEAVTVWVRQAGKGSVLQAASEKGAPNGKP